MNFIERLTKAIRDKNLKTVNAMLQALQTLYDKKDFSITFSLQTLIPLLDENNKEVKLYQIILESDIEIFKSLINFLKKNRIFKNDLENDINHLHYYAIFTNNLPAVKFLVVDISVNLLKPSNGYTEPSPSPLHALLHSSENNNFKIFQFLLPYCIAAYQQAGKDATKTLLDPVIFQLNSLITEQKNKISYVTPYLIPNLTAYLHILENELNLIQCFKDSHEIFFTKDIATLYNKLGYRFLPEFNLKTKITFIKTIGMFMQTLIDDSSKDEAQETDKDTLNFVNQLIFAIKNLINASKNPDDLNKLKETLDIHVMPHYFFAFEKAKEYVSLVEKDAKFYKFVTNYHNLIHEDFFKEKPVQISNDANDTKENSTIEENENKTVNKTETDQISENKAHNEPTQPAEFDVTYELGLIHFYDTKEWDQALELWASAARKGHKEAFKQMLNFSSHKTYRMQFKANMQIGDLYYTGTEDNSCKSDLALAINYWEKALSPLFHHEEKWYEEKWRDYVTLMEKALIETIHNSRISSDLLVLACNLLLNFYLSLDRLIDVLNTAKYAVSIFQKARLLLPDPLFPNIIKELSLLLADPKYRSDCLELFASIETATQTTTKINILDYIENIESLFIIAHAIRKAHGFDKNFFRAAQVYLKIFELCATPDLQNERHAASAALKDLISENNHIAVSLAIRLYKIILEKKLIDHLEFAIEILGTAANCGSTECLQALDILYKQYLNSDKTSFKTVLSKQFLVLAQTHQINSLSEKTIEALIIKAITLDPNISVPLTLDTLKISILNIFKLRDQLNSWIPEALTSFNSANKSSLSNFFTKNKINPLSQLHSATSAMNELSNCITTFLKYGEAELNSNSFSQNIKEIKDIHAAVKIFIVNNQNNFSIDKDNLLFKLTHLLQNCIEENIPEQSLESAQFKW